MTAAPDIATVHCERCGLPFAAVDDDDPRAVVIAGLEVKGMSGRGLLIRCPLPKCRHWNSWKRGRPHVSPLDIPRGPVQDTD